MSSNLTQPMMTESESEIVRLIAEKISRKRDVYHILLEAAWIIENSPEFTETQRNYYRNVFGGARLPSLDSYSQALH